MARNPQFVPDQSEVEKRIEAMTWMQVMGWGADVIDSIMYRDNPTLDSVRTLVYAHGPDKARQIIERIVL